MRRYQFEQFAAVLGYADLTFSPDGQEVAYTANISGQFNVWRQPIAAGPDDHPLLPVQLTVLVEQAARRAIWSPDGTRILTMADRHGTENYQICEIPAENGWLYPITDQPDVRHELGDSPFSPDGRWIAYASNARRPAELDALARDLSSGETRTLLTGDGNFNPASWSPDGRQVLVSQFLSNTNQDLFLCDVETGERRHITPHQGDVQFFTGPWHPDGHGFYVLSNRDREYVGLAFLDLRDGALQWLETPNWDVTDVAIAHDGRYLAWIVNEDGYSRLHVRDHSTGQVTEYADLPKGVYSTLRFSPAGAMLGLFIQRPVQPANIYLLQVQSGHFRPLTRSFLGGVPEDEMVEPDLVRYRTHDGKLIPAWLYRPKTGAAEAKAPVVLSIHGGPESQELPTYGYAGFYQYLLNRGIGVLAPNIRGSTGYGAAYQKLIHRDWGGAELGDLEHAALYLRSLDWVDDGRIAVFGGSFGGFATLSCAARLPRYWAAAVDIVGPSNLLTFARSVPPHWRRYMKEWVGDPEEDVDLLRERSPITYVDNVRAPLLIIQGANDPRVVKAESDQMVERLRTLGCTVEYMVFDDEGHGFTKTTNRLKAFRASAEWLERWLLSEGQG